MMDNQPLPQSPPQETAAETPPVKKGISAGRKWLALFVLAVAAVGLLAAAVLFLFLDFWVDFWWFSSVGYGFYFWQRFLYKYALCAAGGFLVLLAFYVNLRGASLAAARRRARVNPQKEEPAGEEAEKPRGRLARLLTSPVTGWGLVSLAGAAVVAYPLYARWETMLLYLFGGHGGAVDPVFGLDVGHYLFAHPAQDLLQPRLLAAAVALFAMVSAIYLLRAGLEGEQERRLSGGMRLHLAVLLVLTAAAAAWGFSLERHALLYTDAHQPLFFGPGYVEMKVSLPLLWALWGLTLALGASLAANVLFKKGVKVTLAVAALLVLALLAYHSEYLKDQVQKYSVKPNEIAAERPYIANSIKSTLAAFGLDHIIEREYSLAQDKPAVSEPERTLKNVPVWDRDYLMEYYHQIQGIRPYYGFVDVDVDRYMVRGALQQVYLAAREINLDRLPGYARDSWVNLHLRYTHGQGVVMTPAVQGGEEGMVWFIRDIPPRSDYGFTLDRPDIYYGTEDYTWVMVPNDTGELGRAGEEVVTNYRGAGGVRASSLLRRALLALYFKDKNLLFTTKGNKDSRVLFHRNIKERIQRIAPFFLLDEDPYVVVADNRLYWVQDAYTVSRHYPNAESWRHKFNYIRNSVKVVVDAYDGTVTFYAADEHDPLAETYARIYPGLLRPLSEMPDELARHLRY
ncbi:MAG: UPF0182 family protein, partial [Deltaproteobacteria bacterium]|nr:UPF0182 family protein [Deltaproteobacteria bacterium]